MGFRIIKDSIGAGRENRIFLTKEECREPNITFSHRFKLYDDDGVEYYEGIATDESFEPLDWATNDSGCTHIRYFNPTTGEWPIL